MALKLLRSQVPEGFEADVETYRQALLAHRFTVDVPAPQARNHLIEAAVARVQYVIEDKKPDDFVLDYTIEDDPPVPFEDKKNTALNEVLMAERALRNKIMPVGKARLHGIKANDILMAQQKQEAVTAEDENFLKDHKERLARLDELNRDVAQALSDVEDLTELTIDGWQLPAKLSV